MTQQDLLNLAAARATAKTAGMFVAEKAGKWLLIRLAKPRNVVVGSRKNADDLLRLVTRAAATQAKAILHNNTR